MNDMSISTAAQQALGVQSALLPATTIFFIVSIAALPIVVCSTPGLTTPRGHSASAEPANGRDIIRDPTRSIAIRVTHTSVTSATG